MNKPITIRLLNQSDPDIIARAFIKIGWNKPRTQYETYLKEQSEGSRTVFVAVVADEFTGYLTISWKSYYAPFREAAIPEIQDLNVLPIFRKRGIAPRLLALAWACILIMEMPNGCMSKGDMSLTVAD